MEFEPEEISKIRGVISKQIDIDIDNLCSFPDWDYYRMLSKECVDATYVEVPDGG